MATNSMEESTTQTLLEVSDGGWRSCLAWSEDHTPQLEKLLRTVIAQFYTCTDLVIIDAIIHHNSMTEEELHKSLKMELPILRTRIQTLVKHKFLKIRQAGDTNNVNVSMGHIYVDFSRLQNNMTYILGKIREKVQTEEQQSAKQRKWHRMLSYFRCTNPNCSKSTAKIHTLYAIQSFFELHGEFRCTFCPGALEEVSEMHPSIMTLATFNESFGYLYELLRAVDATRPFQSVVENSTLGKRKHEGCEVQVRFIKSTEMETVPVRKEIPPWFLPNTSSFTF